MNRLRAPLLILLLAVAAPSHGAATLPACIEHNISLRVDPSTQTGEIEDHGSMVCGAGWNLLYLADSATIRSFTINGKPVEYTLLPDGNEARLTSELRGALEGVELRRNAALVLFKADANDTVAFQISFVARFDDPVENVRFSREKVGNEVTGTIVTQGAYLSSAACFYPQGTESMARFSLMSDIPSRWTAIADGNPISSEVKGDRRIQRFENPFRSDGYVFMAAPYVVKTTSVDSIVVATYFFEEDSSLCDKYLTATADYIRMYQELIGPYPFRQFTVAENFFPTGYGMPGWTLLGQSVLRLPFIITSSLGHEVLHNWWGNSVYVDYARGNWCEAAAVYGADYRYKLLSSPDAARDYRKDILKEYLSYVNDGNDFPIRTFTSRSSAETRTIGYNKGMMLFHLIEQQIGSEPFFDAWKRIYREHRGKAISWEEWIEMFERTSGIKLGFIIPEWIDRAGAPQIGLEIIGVKLDTVAGRKVVSGQLTQSSDNLYRLTVPVVAEGTGVSESSMVTLTTGETAFEFSVPDAATAIAVDPEYHLFRRLYAEEVEPIISAVLGVENKTLISSLSDTPSNEAFAGFGAALTEDSAKVMTDGQIAGVPRDHAPILLNPAKLPDFLDGHVQVIQDSVIISGQAHPLSGNTFVLAGQNWIGFAKCLVVLTGDPGSLPRLGQLVPHYGKYSYLVFAGTKNIAKGQWSVTNSPLRKALP
ncbi:MAG: hypothetical protein NDJ18_06880 [candidate division Zixibacteria bacterium]|nr:hypothetical protein [candidate division Zixibacteria bacterium]